MRGQRGAAARERVAAELPVVADRLEAWPAAEAKAAEANVAAEREGRRAVRLVGGQLR